MKQNQTKLTAALAETIALDVKEAIAAGLDPSQAAAALLSSLYGLAVAHHGGDKELALIELARGVAQLRTIHAPTN